MTLIILFFLSTIAAFALIARKVWQLRSGAIVAGSYEETDWTDVSIESIRTRLFELAQWAVHHFVLFGLRVWIIISYSFKRADRYVHQRITHFLHKNAHYPEGGKPSRFLKKMREHKNELAHAMQKESGK